MAERHGLDKAVWTQDDFPVMGSHDATVHAIGFDEDQPWAERLLLDLDYIVEWIEPAAPDESFTFFVAPATLVFEGVGVIEADLRPDRLLLTIDHIHRESENDQAPDADSNWAIDGHDFHMRFSARGFHQHFRSAPINAGRSQRLTLRQRGGLSFSEPSTFELVARGQEAPHHRTDE
jgi:hypothetical protein